VSLHDRLLQEAKDAGIDDDEQVKKLLGLIDLAPNSHVKQTAAKKLRAKIRQHRSHPFPEKQSPVVPPSSVKVGRGWKRGWVSLSVDDLPRHVLMSGQSGSGKTTTSYNLMSELDDLDIPFWAFDLKQDYRHLVKSDEMDDILVLPVEKFRFNPLKPPPGVSTGDWLTRFMEVFCDTQELLGGSDRFLDEQLHQFQRQSSQPTLLDLKNYIGNLSLPPQRRQFKYRVKLSIGRLLRDSPHTFDVVEGYDLEKLLKRNVVFEFDGLKKWAKNFLMEILIAWIYEYRKAQNHRGDGVRHVTFLDEAKTILSVYKEQQVASGLPEIDRMVAELREFQESLIVADQEANKLTDSIKANTYTKILLATGDAKEFRAMAESLKMDRLQERWARKLGVGQAVIQKGERDPVPVDLPNFELEKDVTDEQLVSRMSEEWRDLSFQPLDSSTSESVDTAETASTASEEESSDDDIVEEDISETGMQLLEDVVDNPFIPVSERYEKMSSYGTGNRAKKELIESGVIEEAKVKKEGSTLTLLEITGTGREYVEKEGIDFERVGRGGIEHRYWQHKIKGLLEQAGYTAKREYYDIDVYGNNGEFEIGVEVALGPNEREVDHVKKNLEIVDQVVVAAKGNNTRSGLKKKLEKEFTGSDNFDVRVLEELAVEDVQFGGES